MITTRRATVEDLELVLADVQAGFDSYTAFAPEGWLAPNMYADRAMTADLLVQPDTWALLAFDDGVPAGHVSFFPGRRRTEASTRGDWRARPPVPGLAHLWHLFVLPPWWGRGVGPLLHDAAIDEMRTRGYERARLYTPSQHVRARRFYERRGWEAAAEEFHEFLSLDLAEYRLTL